MNSQFKRKKHPLTIDITASQIHPYHIERLKKRLAADQTQLERRNQVQQQKNKQQPHQAQLPAAISDSLQAADLNVGDPAPDDLRHRSRGRGKKKKQQPQPQPQQPPLTDAEANDLLTKSVAHYPDASPTTPPCAWQQNAEWGNANKFRRFAEGIKAVMAKMTFASFEEVSQDWMQTLASAVPFNCYWTTDNGREQRCGIAFRKDVVKVLEWGEIHKVADVNGIDGLRPVVYAHIEMPIPNPDGNGTKVVDLWVACAHLKSMRGGEKTTGWIRHQQAQIVADFFKDKPTIFVGDLNSIDDTELKPLFDAGFADLGQESGIHYPTQGKSVLDRVLYRDLPCELEYYWVLQINSGRVFSDHNGVTYTAELASTADSTAVNVPPTPDPTTVVAPPVAPTTVPTPVAQAA